MLILGDPGLLKKILKEEHAALEKGFGNLAEFGGGDIYLNENGLLLRVILNYRA